MTKIVPIQPYPDHPLRALKRFTAAADQIAARYNRLDELPHNIRRKMQATANRELIDKLFVDARRAAVLNKHDEAMLAECHVALQRFDPESAYEDNDREGNLKRNVIGERVAMLVGAFPNAAPGDPGVFVRMLIENVSSVEYLILPALDAAIWEIVGTMKFIPAVSEVLETVNKQQETWSDRLWAISNITSKSRWATEVIKVLEIEAEQAAKTQAVEWARHQQRKAIAEAVDAQERAATAAQAVASKLAWLAQCEVQVQDAERALAEAVKRNAGAALP